jgi:hypothetical protein
MTEKDPFSKTILPVKPETTPETKQPATEEILQLEPALADIIKEKFLASWGTARDQFGVPNNHRLAEVLFKSLYDTEAIEHEEILGRPEFNRKETLSTKIDLNSNIVPAQEEFITSVRRAATRETKFDECLYPGALEFLENITKYGPVTMWTRGDVHGISSTDYHGSHEQLKRMAIAGVGDIRKNIARDRGVKNQDVISIAAAENKFELLEGILRRYKDMGINDVIIIDDQPKNILKFLDTCKNYKDFNFVPVWVRQGVYKNTLPKEPLKSIEQWKSEFNALDNVADMVKILKEKDILTENGEKSVGFIVDYDDVLLDDNKRKAEQIKSLLDMMTRKGWLNPKK